jgi:hypothetical protein
MKKIYSYFLPFVFLTVLTLSGIAVQADPPNPPVVPGSHGQQGDAGAPIDGMSILLLVSGSVFAGWMLYRRTPKKEETVS